VAVDASGTLLGQRRLPINAGTLGQLRAWAAGWPVRRFAVEGAYGLGRPIAQQLAAAGEQVWDVPATLAARARLLNAGGRRKTDAADAASVAQAALHCPRLRTVAAEDQTTILRLLAERRDDLAGERTRILNRLHVLLRDLLPGGAPPTCRRTRPLRCCAACARPRRPTPAADSWPASCSATCDAWTPAWPTTRFRSGTRWPPPPAP
jgi:transposase